MKSVTLAKVRLQALGRDEVDAWVEHVLAGDQLCHLVTVNPEFIVAAQRHPHFCVVLNQADVALCDGFGLVLAARLCAGQTLDRLTGVDLTEHLLTQPRHGQSIFLLGGIDQAAMKVRALYPDANIVGVHEGGVIDSRGVGDSDAAVIDAINASGATVLLVAFGHPKQELWIARHRASLTHIRIAMGVGGTFDYLAGRVPRAPLVMRRLGLEWLYRLIRQPARWRRILDAVVVFPWLVIFGCIRGRLIA